MISMNAKIVGIGSTFLLVITYFAVVLAPAYTDPEMDQPSDIYRPRTALFIT